MGRIANLKMECPKCNKITNIFVEESDSSHAKVKCEHCLKIFDFGPGMMYSPVGYVVAKPKWAEIDEK